MRRGALRSAVKAISQRAGLFPQVRRLYRALDPELRGRARRERAFYGTFIAPGDLVFDIGANLGQKSEIFLACGARVVAAEPNPLCAPTLMFELGRCRRFILVKKAVGAAEGRARLNVVGTESTASLRADWKWLGAGSGREADAVAVEIAVTTLDALIAAFGAPAFCKIDVEGFELECLMGLSRPLPLVSFEYHLDEAERLDACLARLSALSAVTANAIGLNKSRLLFESWLAPEALLERARAGAMPPAGDVFVRSSA